MGDHKLPDERRIEIARKTSIPVLSGLDVVQNLRGEMAEEEEWFLTGEVLDISAAKMGMICIQDDTPGRIARDGDIEECPLTRKLVPVEEVIRKDTETFWFFDQLQALVTDHEIPLIIPPTEKVLSFMKEHGEYWVCPVFTDWLPLRRGDTLEGYDLLLWMAENDVWPSKGKPYIRPILREPRGCAG